MSTPKFGNDPTTEALYVMSLDGWFTESSGNVEAPTGWFAWTEIRENELGSTEDGSGILGAFEKEFADIEGLDPMSLVGGWILYQDSQGFVDAVEYELTPQSGLAGWVQRSSAHKAYVELEAEYAAWADESDES